jgi:hypothetical protein
LCFIRIFYSWAHLFSSLAFVSAPKLNSDQILTRASVLAAASLAAAFAAAFAFFGGGAYFRDTISSIIF